MSYDPTKEYQMRKLPNRMTVVHFFDLFNKDQQVMWTNMQEVKPETLTAQTNCITGSEITASEITESECFILALFSGGFIPKYAPVTNLIPIQG
jgi:hypothetical protein